MALAKDDELLAVVVPGTPASQGAPEIEARSRLSPARTPPHVWPPMPSAALARRRGAK